MSIALTNIFGTKVQGKEIVGSTCPCRILPHLRGRKEKSGARLNPYILILSFPSQRVSSHVEDLDTGLLDFSCYYLHKQIVLGEGGDKHYIYSYITQSLAYHPYFSITLMKSSPFPISFSTLLNSYYLSRFETRSNCAGKTLFNKFVIGTTPYFFLLNLFSRYSQLILSTNICFHKCIRFHLFYFLLRISTVQSNFTQKIFSINFKKPNQEVHN